MSKPSSKKVPVVASKPPPEVGEVLASKFRVEQIIGRGGMGVVIQATNIQLDQKVALKLLHTGADDPSTVERFTQEARAAARLRSEHVARVFDVGRDEKHGPYIVMEFLDGRTLAEVLAQTGRVALHRAVEYVIDACEGLAEAHVREIVHQDVKPANLFLLTGADGRPSIKVLDFGIATMRTAASAELVQDSTSSHRNAGTPAYLAPEQIRGTPKPDHRADVWALGCVLYELLVGQRAFQATRFTELVTQILEQPHAPFPADVDIPQPVKDIVARCLQRERDLRFTSTGELALALLPFARRRAHSSVARAVAHVKSGGLDLKLEMPSSMPPPPSSSGEVLDDTFPSSTKLRAPGVPALAGFTPGGIPTSTDVSSSHDVAAMPPSSTRGGKSSSNRGLLIVGLISLILVSVSAVLAWTRFAPRPASASAATALTTELSSPSVSPNVGQAPTESAAAPSESTTPKKPGDPRRGPVWHRPMTPNGGGGAGTPTTSPAPRPESEIRHTR